MARYTINSQYQYKQQERGFIGSLIIAIMSLMTVFVALRIGASVSTEEHFITSLRQEADARTNARTCLHDFIIQFTYFYPISVPSSLYDSALCSVRFLPTAPLHWRLSAFATSSLIVVKEEIDIERNGLSWAIP